MSGDRTIEDRISRWLEEDAVGGLPDRVLESVFAETRAAPRRSRPFAGRVPTMSRFGSGLVAVGAAAIVLLVAAALLGSRPPSSGVGPAASSPGLASPTLAAGVTSAPSAAAARFPLLPALDATFRSPWYGYQVRYPSGWTVAPGMGPWPQGTKLLHGDVHLDQIVSPGIPYREANGITISVRMRIVGASIALPSGMTMDGFRAFASPPLDCAPLDPLPQRVLIGGVEALVSLNGCRSESELNGDIYDLLVIAGGRGYDFTLDGYITSSDVLSWLAAISLEPGSAPSPGSTPGSSAH